MFAGCGPVPIISIPVGAWVTTGGDAGFLAVRLRDGVRESQDRPRGRLPQAGHGRAERRAVRERRPHRRAAVGRPIRARPADRRQRGRRRSPRAAPGSARSARSPGPRFRRSRPLVFRSPGSGSTFVYIPKPRRGSYSFDEVAGSTPIRKVTVSYGEPRPEDQGVRPQGPAALLDRGLGSHKVTFFEQARRFQAPLGRARGRRGSIRLTPNPGPGGRRRVVALVESGRGLPRARRTVASFRAPRQGRLRRPGRPSAGPRRPARGHLEARRGGALLPRHDRHRRAASSGAASAGAGSR